MPTPLPDRRQFALAAAAAALGSRAAAVPDDHAAKARRSVRLVPPGNLDCADEVAFSADAAVVAVFQSDDTVTVFETATGKHLNTLAGPGFEDPYLFAAADGGRAVVAWGGRKGACVAWDVKTGKARTLFEKAFGGDRPERDARGAVSADGKRVATLHDGGGCPTLVRVWDAGTGKQLWELNYAGGQSDVYGLAFSPDGKRLAAGTQDRAVTVYDADTGKPAAELRGDGRGAVRAVGWSADGKRLLALHDGPTARAAVWDVATGKPAGEVTGLPKSLPLGPVLSPDGTRVAAVTTDRGLAVWDVPSEEPLTVPVVVAGRRGLAWSADGKALLFLREYSEVHELLTFHVEDVRRKK
ncbi:MAG: hypothetical protein C0501_06620 [Isosphaera sp.]|nr:hypothetical protein [Isosphaera sp.]